MIRIERNRAFWTGVAGHPALASALMGISPEAVGAISERADVLPVAAQHGGFLFARSDPLGFVAELHTLFTPEGWGREALMAGMAAIGLVWLSGFSLVTTFEVETNPKSRPPKTFGFIIAGDWRQTPCGNLRLWTLSRAAWDASPAAQRRNAKCL